jgi:hypothetical protein
VIIVRELVTVIPQPFGGERLEEFDEGYHITNLLEVVEELTGCRVFTCGSQNCGSTIIVQRNKSKPRFCTLCRHEIDWTGIPDEPKTRVCPQCKKEYRKMEDYCEVDGSELEIA